MSLKLKYFSFFILILQIIILPSCTRQNPAYNRENIKATWIVEKYDGEEIALSKRTTYTFDKDGGLIINGIKNSGEDNYKWGKSALLNYKVHCCNLEINGSLEGFFDISTSYKVSQNFEIVRQKDSSLTIKVISYKIDDNDVDPSFTESTLTKLPSTYSKAESLFGLWEYDGSAYNPFRIELRSSNSLKFYIKSDDTLSWELVSKDDYYNLYYKFIALTLFNNPVFGVTDKWRVATLKILSHTNEQLILINDQNVELHFKLVTSEG
jgi:hypothetical protein